MWKQSCVLSILFHCYRWIKAQASGKTLCIPSLHLSTRGELDSSRLPATIFTATIARRLRSWLEQKSKICSEQADFQSNHSTIDTIFALYSNKIILRHVYGEGWVKVYVTFVDYRTAFDSVSREQLWSIMDDMGMSTKSLLLLKTIYKNAQFCFR